jgi:hypothetical protein
MLFSPCNKIHWIQSAPLTERTQTNEREEMRKASTLIGLSLFALAASARAQEAAPAADTAAPPASSETAAPVPAADTSASPAGLAAATPMPVEPAALHRKIQVGLSFLPMAKGKFPAGPSSATPSVDAAFAYGVGLSAGYEVLPGLVVGIAPQMTLNVKAKEDPGDAGKQYDLMLRVAYAHRLVDTIAVYAEVLPGYSRIVPPEGFSASGLVLALGVGAAMDLTDRIFANFGVGYEMGFQKSNATGREVDAKTEFLRLALGGGVKF